MKISVTQEDIDKGKREDSCVCPIALAVRRQTGRLFHIDDTNADDGYDTIQLPIKARQFVRSYDNGNPVEPFEFELEGL